ncbi:hypothetical protein HU745_07315 [Pseudomonas mosselii]|uniref:hypothetical protein n=1 Tax=Pseudomonas mosselii TaxID=78327 RepID=UPI0016448BD8|nr:hypothetical protein [Pseudomonas mosselii]MBC3450860.1 hypothetical protein [Pseudomonas mosselii]
MNYAEQQLISLLARPDMKDLKLLTRFRDEVLFTGPESTLPSNLTDFWLDELQRHLKGYFDSLGRDTDNGEEDVNVSLPLAAITHILFAKIGGKVIFENLENLHEYFQSYRRELALEKMTRKTRVTLAPATLETIFSNREVLIERSSAPH